MSDIRMLPWRYRCVVYGSAMLRSISTKMPWVGALADSWYVTALKL